MGVFTILLVEDNKTDRDEEMNMITHIGAQVIAADNGKSAVNVFSAKGNNFFDMILMKVNMPIMDGFEATRAIRALGEGNCDTIPIIAMATSTTDKDLEAYLSAGIDDYISKPFLEDLLANKILIWNPMAELKQEFDGADTKYAFAPEMEKKLEGTGFSVPTGMKNAGSEENYRQQLNVFATKVKPIMKDIETALNERDFEKVRCNVSSIREMTESLGNQKLSMMCGKIEIATSKKNEKYLTENLPIYMKACVVAAENVTQALEIGARKRNRKKKYATEHFEVKNILAIGKTKNLTFDGVIRDIKKAGYTVDFERSTSIQNRDTSVRCDACIVYADAELFGDKGSLKNVITFLTTIKRIVILFGTVNEMKMLNQLLPKGMILGAFPPPYDMTKIMQQLVKIFTDGQFSEQKKLLVVDSQSFDLDATRKKLESEFTVATAGSALEGFEKLLSDKFDMVLADYEIPYCGGKSFIQMLHADKRFEKLPVMFLSNNDDAGCIMEANACNAVGYHLKSIDEDDLIDDINDFFDD